MGSTMNRFLIGLLSIFIVYCSGICIGSEKQADEHGLQNSQDEAGKTKRLKKKAGPFVILDVTEYEGQAYLYHSFEIIDEDGVSYYKKDLG